MAGLLLHRLVQAACFVAVLAALKYGYDFGNRLGGRWLGVVMAVNAAVFCALVVAAVAQRACAPRGRVPHDAP